MREQILETLWKHDQDRYGVDMRGTSNVDKAADDLMQLMCYREVRAYWTAYVDFNDPFDYNIEQEILGSFYEEYPEEMLLKAIEQYKNRTT